MSDVRRHALGRGALAALPRCRCDGRPGSCQQVSGGCRRCRDHRNLDRLANPNPHLVMAPAGCRAGVAGYVSGGDAGVPGPYRGGLRRAGKGPSLRFSPIRPWRLDRSHATEQRRLVWRATRGELRSACHSSGTRWLALAGQGVPATLGLDAAIPGGLSGLVGVHEHGGQAQPVAGTAGPGCDVGCRHGGLAATWPAADPQVGGLAGLGS